MRRGHHWIVAGGGGGRSTSSTCGRRERHVSPGCGRTLSTVWLSTRCEGRSAPSPAAGPERFWSEVAYAAPGTRSVIWHIGSPRRHPRVGTGCPGRPWPVRTAVMPRYVERARRTAHPVATGPAGKRITIPSESFHSMRKRSSQKPMAGTARAQAGWGREVNAAPGNAPLDRAWAKRSSAPAVKPMSSLRVHCPRSPAVRARPSSCPPQKPPLSHAARLSRRFSWWRPPRVDHATTRLSRGKPWPAIEAAGHAPLTLAGGIALSPPKRS